MTKNTIYKIVKYISFASFFFALASCSDEFFDVEVGERITEDEHYKEEIDAKSSFFGTLISLQDVAANSVIVDGLRSDQMVLNPNASSELFEIGNLSMRADNPLLDRSGYYRTIINVNEVLARIQVAADRDREFSEGELFDMRATLYGLRAWCYLNVVRNYGEVNWIADNLAELPKENEGIILNKAELLDSLITSFHRDSVIYTGGSSRTQNVYTQFPNHLAVLGELYLEQGLDYEKAAEYLKLGMEMLPTESINGVVAGLNRSKVYKVSDYTENAWDNIFNNSETRYNENICVIPYNQAESQANPIVQYFLPEDLYMVKPAQHLVDSMEMAIQSGKNPDTADVYRGLGITYDTIVAGEYYIKKYSINTSDPYSTDVILQRAADVNLLLAEALNRSGRSDVALILLNQGIFSVSPTSNRPSDFGYWISNQGIRGRVRLSAKEVPDSIDNRPITDMERIEMIEDFIIEEKAMECAFEGKRMSDLIRVALRRDNPEEYISSILARKHSDPADQARVKSYYMSRSNWYLPIN